MDNTYCKQILQQISTLQSTVQCQLNEISDISGQPNEFCYSFQQQQSPFFEEIVSFQKGTHSTADYLIFFMRLIDNIKSNQSDVVTQYQEELQKLASYIQELESSISLIKR